MNNRKTTSVGFKSNFRQPLGAINRWFSFVDRFPTDENCRAYQPFCRITGNRYALLCTFRSEKVKIKLTIKCDYLKDSTFYSTDQGHFQLD